MGSFSLVTNVFLSIPVIISAAKSILTLFNDTLNVTNENLDMRNRGPKEYHIKIPI